ncbi:hypothetical protein D3C80_2213790 [compost metagenome]
MELHAFGTHTREYYLYEDDGISYAYREGRHNWLKVGVDQENRVNVERTGDFTGCRYQFTVAGSPQPAQD